MGNHAAQGSVEWAGTRESMVMTIVSYHSPPMISLAALRQPTCVLAQNEARYLWPSSAMKPLAPEAIVCSPLTGVRSWKY